MPALPHHTCDGSPGYGLVAVKRPWVPEWLWAALCVVAGPLLPLQPLRWLLTEAA
jgi:hypothetical protein